MQLTNEASSSNPGTFITVLSGWSVFLSPMTGIVVSDYFLVHHGEYHIGDMYMGNPRSAYWYTHGFNWRGFTAWAFGMTPLLRTSAPVFLSLSLSFCKRANVGKTKAERLTTPETAGFARAIQGTSSGNGWDQIYEISYFYGFFTSLTLHWLFHAFFPAERQRGSSPFVLDEHAEMIQYGESDSVAEADHVVSASKA